MKFFLSVFIFFNLLTVISAKAQKVDSMMKIYTEQFPQQKVYVHFDKSIYRAGETIWFKAYVLAGFFPAINSRSFFAELIDNAGNVVQRKAYPVLESSAAGDFEIPENYASGNLRFRAYTTWMLNFDTSFLFTKNITILNKTGKAATVTNQKRQVSLRFFPEGGNLVSNIESLVAFKANDNFGNPVEVKGTVKNSEGKVVTTFSSRHDGMGTFRLTPLPNETYTATYQDEQNTERSATLPAALNEGVTLTVSSTGNKAVFVVKRTQDENNKIKSVFIIAHVAQQMVFKAKVPLDRLTVNSGSFSIDQHPSGIMQFTIFSEDWKPVAERVIMVMNDEYLFKADVKPLTVNPNKRAKNVLEVEVEDTLLTNLSIAITDAELKEDANSENIISKLILTGDLKGYVHNPAYYFNDSNGAKNIDLVMLTNGWRRYNWGDVVMNKTPVIRFPDTSYLSMNAKVFGISPSNRLRNDESISAVLQMRDSSTNFIEIPKVSADSFSLPNVLFYDTITVFYQFSKNKKLNNKVNVLFNNGLYSGHKKINTENLPLVTLASSDSALARTQQLANEIIKYGSSWEVKGNVLETVTVRTKQKSVLQQLDEKYASGLFSGYNGYAFDFINGTKPTDIFTFLQSQVPGLRVNRSGGIFGGVNIEWRNSPTAIFVDEMSMDADYLQSISIQDIAYVKVFRPPFYGATGGGSGGAIAIYTRKGNDEVFTNKGLASNKVAGYAVTKEFYSPDYSTRSGSADVVADYRSTLYWNPYILTDSSTRKVKVEFYNNDISKAFRVVLEGVNEVGKVVRVDKIIQE